MVNLRAFYQEKGRVYAQKSLKKVIDLIWPIDCLVCGLESNWLCHDCLENLPISRRDLCAICSKAAENGICLNCQEQLKIDGIISPFSYRLQPIQQIIKQAKYLGYFDALTYMGSTFSELIMERLPKDSWTASAIPLSQNRLKERGFNQAEVFAKAVIGKDFIYEQLLARVRETEPQASLDKSERVKNVRSCFETIIERVPKKILLFDDVVTTGQTASQAAKVLKKAESQKVWLVALAHG